MTDRPHAARPLSSARRRVLLVDNYDSYTGNLFQLIWCETGQEPDVVENDTLDVDAIERSGYSHIVLGPGPGTPHDPDDVGRSLELIRRTRALVLGVCFGFQSIAVAVGGKVERSPRPAHGLIERISRTDSPLFDGIPEQFDVVRYHSLCVRQPIPPSLRATAWTDDGVLMAAESVGAGLYGVQFHPESIGMPHGPRVVGNFLRIGRADAAGASTGGPGEG